MTDFSKLDAPEVLEHIFYPQSTSRDPQPEGSIDLDIKVDKDITLGCRFFSAAKDAPTIVYFHGNGETVYDYNTISRQYVENGLNLFVTTYRGYGWSTGSPSVSTMLSDASIILSEIKNWLIKNDFTDTIFLMGRSLGSAVAIDLTRSNQDVVKGLIIESGFADTLPLARILGIKPEEAGITEQDCFCNCEKIAEIKNPTLILHGARDEMIPVAMAEKLQAESGARNKQFMVIPGAEHNSMIETGGIHYFETIKKFTDTVLGKNDWRSRRRKFRKKQQNG